MMKKILFFIGFLWVSILSTRAQTNISIGGGAKVVVEASTIVKANAMNNAGAGSGISNNGIVYLTSDFNQTTGATYTGGASSWLWFQGTSTQNITGDASMSIARLKVDNPTTTRITQNITIATDLAIINGVLDLNGRTIDLGSTGTMSENRASNFVIKDNTAINASIPGGSVTFSATVTNATSELRGTGLYLMRTAGADYSINATIRYYVPGINFTGMKKIYTIVGSPSGTNSTMRYYYATSQLNGIIPSDLVLFRYRSTSGWRQATDAGSGYSNGTNVVNDYIEALGINGFSDWTGGSFSFPLPITLLSFTGKRIDENNVKLDWATATEINNQGFDVEISDNAIDFVKEASLDGKGNSNNTVNYTLNVLNSSGGYFRLKQIDFDGNFTYSQVIFIEGTTFKTFKVYPNPASEAITIQLDSRNHKDADILIYNALGVIVKQARIQGNTVNLKVNDLSRGTYFIKVGVQVQKLIVE